MARRPAARRRNPRLAPDYSPLARLGFLGIEPGESGCLVNKAAERIVNAQKLATGPLVIHDMDRLGAGGEPLRRDLRVTVTGAGVVLAYSGKILAHVSQKPGTSSRFTRNILTSGCAVLVFDEDADDIVTGRKLIKFVGEPVEDGFACDFLLSQFGVEVVHEYSWRKIEAAAGSVGGFFEAIYGYRDY